MSRGLVKLKSLAARERYSLVGGPFGSKLTSADYVDDGIPVIRGSNLNGGRYLDESGFVFVSEQKMREDLFGNLAHPGDVVFTQRGTLGQTALIPNDARFSTYVISQSQMKLTVDPEKADPRFIYYYFSSREAVQKILNQNSSSGVPHINLTSLRNFPVPEIGLREQRNIADFLSAYDDLIENNRRRIALLEEAARLLYREWFVHFRFPGHEHVKIIDGVPEGWERRTLGDASENHDRKRIPLSVMEREKRKGHYPYYGAASILDYVDGYIFDGRYLLMGEDGTVITERGTPMLQLVEGKFWVNNHAHILRGTTVSTEMLYCALSEYRIQGHVTGVAQPKITQKNMNRIPVVMPPEFLRQEFHETVIEMFDQKFTLERFNQKLAQARDLLLPRLMNGEIAI